MKNINYLFLVLFAAATSNLSAQDLVGLSHKQVIDYWQKTVAVEQISDNNDLVVINNSIFCSFDKKICVDYTTTISEADLEKHKAQLNANKDLHYDDKTQTWINTIKKFAWKLTKVSDTDYELSCKKL